MIDGVSIVVVVYRHVQDVKILEALVKNNLEQDTVSGNVKDAVEMYVIPTFLSAPDPSVFVSCLCLPGDVSLFQMNGIPPL